MTENNHALHSSPTEALIGEKLVVDALGPDHYLDFRMPHTVGVKGDERVWGETVVIRTLNPAGQEAAYRAATETGQNGECDLADLSNAITAQMPAVARVCVDITPHQRVDPYVSSETDLNTIFPPVTAERLALISIPKSRNRVRAERVQRRVSEVGRFVCRPLKTMINRLSWS